MKFHIKDVSCTEWIQNVVLLNSKTVLHFGCFTRNRKKLIIGQNSVLLWEFRHRPFSTVLKEIIQYLKGVRGNYSPTKTVQQKQYALNTETRSNMRKSDIIKQGLASRLVKWRRHPSHRMFLILMATVWKCNGIHFLNDMSNILHFETKVKGNNLGISLTTRTNINVLEWTSCILVF